MKVAGIITEYNPFHKGHEYHIEKAKELTGADYVIAVMSGDYVQRGTPACIQKHTRAHMALVSGVDLVLELPIIYATGSAEKFAEGAVRILNSLGVVNCICFGCESGSAAPLMEIAHVLNNEPKWYSEALQTYLKEGYSYPAARAAALPSYTSILSEPNNILGIEYCKAILRLDSDIEPVAIKRQGNGYHESELNDTLPSATAIRNQLYTIYQTQPYSNEPYSCIDQYIPTNTLDILQNELDESGLIHENDFSQLLLYRLLEADTPHDYQKYEDVSEQLASRIFNLRAQFLSFSQFADLLKTKELTRTRINRALLHIILNIHKGQSQTAYARIIGFRKDAKALMSHIKEHSQIPFFSKTADAANLLNEEQLNLFELTMHASMIYESIIAQKMGRTLKHEHSKQIIIIK